MIDESCGVPRENLDDGFNLCRRQVMDNGELCQYAHMYDVMYERYDREGETSYLNSVKRDRISQSTPSQSTGGGKIYSQDTNGVEGFISTSETLEPTTNAEIPSSKAVADYVDAHSMDTPPNKFYYVVSPFPSDTWEGEMTINVTPVFSVKIGAYTYVLTRVYAYKKFNYTGSADNINLFTILKPVGDYTGVFSDSTRIPLTFNVFGRSNTDGTYGLTPKGSDANLSLNHQTVSSVFNLGNFDISSNLKCVFGEGTNTPGVAVSVDCIALMWHSVS